MQKGPHLEFCCTGCSSPVPFSVIDLSEQKHLVPCPTCKKKYVFDDETLIRQLKKFSNLCLAIHDSEEILGNATIGVNLGKEEVKIPFKLLLTRLSSTLDLMIGDTPLSIVFRIEPSDIKPKRAG